MSEELDYTPDLYTLVDEDGKEQTFEMLDAMQVEGEDYYALTPFYDEDPEAALQDDGELVILKASTDENGEDIMMSIDDEAEFEKIGALFMERIEEMFALDECDCEDDCDCHLN